MRAWATARPSAACRRATPPCTAPAPSTTPSCWRARSTCCSTIPRSISRPATCWCSRAPITPGSIVAASHAASLSSWSMPKSHEGTPDVIGRKDDPAFLYFPNNYRWSMGLLICLSGAPWVGVEIDEVHRVGRALADHVGDDHAWFEEWTRIGDRIATRGRAELGIGHKLTAASCFRRASRYYQTGERFIHPRSPRSMEVYAR